MNFETGRYQMEVGMTGRYQMEVQDMVDPAASKPSKARSSKWVDEYACYALCMLIMDDRRIGSTWDNGVGLRRRRALPPLLYREAIGPFLRFDGLLPNMLYAFGGRNQESGPLETVEMFNTYHGQWVPMPSMPKRRAGSAAAVLDDGRMMVIGGYTEDGIAQGLLASCDVFNPFTGQWTEDGAAPLSRARWGHGAASLQGKVYVVGGCSLQLEAQAVEAFMVTLRQCEIYLPDENRWIPTGSLQTPRSGTRVVALDCNHLAAIGGCDDVFGRAETQPTVELYDAVTEKWSLLPQQLRTPRTTAGAATCAPGRLLVIGGAPETSMCSAEVYRVQMPEASEHGEDGVGEAKVDDLPDRRMGCQAAVLSLPSNGKTYPVTQRRCVVVIGGEKYEVDEASRVRQMSSVPVFDTELGKWREDRVVPPMPGPRTAVAVCVGMGRGQLPVGPLPSRRPLFRLGMSDVPHLEDLEEDDDDMETDEEIEQVRQDIEQVRQEIEQVREEITL